MSHGDVANAYNQIFSEDPLLLDEKSQNRYSEALLSHLLLNRTMNAFWPVLVDLHNEEERKFFQQRPRASPVSPSTATVERYKETRRNRTKLEKSAREELQPITMVSRGEMTQNRVTVYTTNDEAEKLLETSKSKLGSRLRIAAVGYRVQVSKLANSCHLDEELCSLPPRRGTIVPRIDERQDDIDLGRTVAQKGDALNEWIDAILTHIGTALDRQSHFIVLPEFSLPPSRDKMNTMEKRIFALSNRADAADHFLFAGTRHEGGSNRGLIISKQNRRTSKPWWHYKIAPARALGENILGPFGTKRASYSACFHICEGEEPNFPIDIAICYDSFDPTTFLSLILQSLVSTDTEIRPRVLIVPSFNTSIDFVALLRDLSFLSRSIVLYVNGLHGDAKLYIAGFAVSDFIGQPNVDRVCNQLRVRAVSLKSERQSILKKFRLNPDQATKVTDVQRRGQALQTLARALEELRRDGALDFIVTLEGKSRKYGEPDRYDPSDLLYYNIDMELINTLFAFRAEYFGSDLFLPKPFQYDRLKTSALAMRDKIMGS